MPVTGATSPGSGSGTELRTFLRSLIAEGRAVVASNLAPGDAPESILPLLEQLDVQCRAELSGEGPAFRPASAIWAARLVYQLCQFTVCRELGEERVQQACRLPCPEPRGPGTDWSADLVLRHLPRLHQLAARLSQADPLVKELKIIAAAWPLSSVGIAGLPTVSLDSFLGHPALRRLYLDRIVEAGDRSRLGDARVDDLLREDLGIHRDLAPALVLHDTA